MWTRQACAETIFHLLFFFLSHCSTNHKLEAFKAAIFFLLRYISTQQEIERGTWKKYCNKTIATITTTTATTKSQTTAAIFLLLNCERLRCSTVGVIFAFQVWTVPPNDLFHSYSHTRTHIHTHTFILFCSLFLSFSLSRYTFNSSLSLPFHVPRTI